MIRLSSLPFFALGWVATSLAGEFTVESRPFRIEKSIAATAVPDAGGVLLKLEPKSWLDFQIVELADHGRRVAVGEMLVRFESEDIDKKLVDARRALATLTLNQAQAELDLKYLRETVPHQLEASRRAAEIAKEEHSYFTKIRRKATEDATAQALERKKQALSNQQEELRQLTKMYAVDEATEETEEIILTRQKDAVVSAEFALRMETLDFKRSLEVTLPREAITLANYERDTAIKLIKAEEDLPRSIELKKIDLDNLTTACQRAKQELTELEADRTLFEIKAPAEGWFYHGPIENGRWVPTEAIKSLYVHGRPPVNRSFATFIPATAKLSWVAFLDDATARSLAPEITGCATLAGREDLEIPVKLTKVAAVPCPDGTYRTDFSANWPKDCPATSGAIAQIQLITYQQAASIAVPTKALTHDGSGWGVDVKLTDGKTERRPVKRGRVSKDSTEIRGGLEVGQVVLIPDEDAKPKGR